MYKCVEITLTGELTQLQEITEKRRERQEAWAGELHPGSTFKSLELGLGDETNMAEPLLRDFAGDSQHQSLTFDF